MACFVAPAAEAVVMTVVEKAVKAKENKEEVNNDNSLVAKESTSIPFSHKIKWLNNMLWGGSALLAFEHVWHGEITPFFPFLTAANNSKDFVAMLHEISTVGMSMAALVTAIWAGMVAVTNVIEKKNNDAVDIEKVKQVR